LHIQGDFGAAQPALPSGISSDALLLLERDQFPNPAGVSIAMVSGEDALIRYGSTNGDLQESNANVGIFDYDIHQRSFRFMPRYDNYDNSSRGPGREFLGERLSVFDEACVLPPLGIATSTATQKNSTDLWLSGSMWNGTGEGHEGFAFRTVASTTVNESARLAVFWGTNLESDQSLTPGNRSFGERFSVHSVGYADFGAAASGARIRIDVFTDAARPFIGTATNTKLTLGVNATRSGGCTASGYWGFGNQFDWATVVPIVPFHVYTNVGTVARFERNGGGAATAGYLDILITDYGNGYGDAILDACPNGDIALRSHAGAGGVVRVQVDGLTKISGGTLNDGETCLSVDRKASGATATQRIQWKDFSNLQAGDKVLVLAG